jgi:hypothetical protein
MSTFRVRTWCGCPSGTCRLRSLSDENDRFDAVRVTRRVDELMVVSHVQRSGLNEEASFAHLLNERLGKLRLVVLCGLDSPRKRKPRARGRLF